MIFGVTGMKKVSAGLVGVLLAIVIALVLVACGGGSNELTYTGDSQASSSNNQNISQTLPWAASTENTDTTESTAETVLYQLTTQQGETVQVLSTTMPSTELPTMNYDPVTVPTMATTYISTTAYVPPTYSYSEQGQVTVRTTAESTTAATTEVKIKSVDISGNNNDGSINGSKLVVCLENVFGNKINKKTGKLTVNYGSETYSVSCSVLSTLYAGNQVEIDAELPSALREALETASDPYAYVTVPKGLVTGSDNVTNKECRITVYVD